MRSCEVCRIGSRGSSSYPIIVACLSETPLSFASQSERVEGDTLMPARQLGPRNPADSGIPAKDRERGIRYLFFLSSHLRLPHPPSTLPSPSFTFSSRNRIATRSCFIHSLHFLVDTLVTASTTITQQTEHPTVSFYPTLAQAACTLLLS